MCHTYLLVLLLVCFVFSAGGPGAEDHAADANLQDLEAGSSLDRPQSLWLHTETVLPAGLCQKKKRNIEINCCMY